MIVNFKDKGVYCLGIYKLEIEGASCLPSFFRVVVLLLAVDDNNPDCEAGDRCSGACHPIDLEEGDALLSGVFSNCRDPLLAFEIDRRSAGVSI